MSITGEVVSVNVSLEKGVIKKPVAEIVVDSCGIVADAHAGRWHRQISLLAKEDIDRFSSEMGRSIGFGEFAENITVEGIDLGRACVLDTIRIGDVELEVSQIGKKCHGDGCAIFQEIGQCVMPKQGIFGRVVKGGKVKSGDEIEFIERPFRVWVLTMSDRAFAGEYSDRSGPKAVEMIEGFFEGKRWHVRVDNEILPDDAGELKERLEKLVGDGVDVIFTLGGTGVGPRDITPEVVVGVCEKIVPGIMENIRIKFAQDKPSALLSRSVAGVAGRTQIYALPGSVKAVSEYLGEIFKTLEHAVYMIHGLDVH